MHTGRNPLAASVSSVTHIVSARSLPFAIAPGCSLGQSFHSPRKSRAQHTRIHSSRPFRHISTRFTNLEPGQKWWQCGNIGTNAVNQCPKSQVDCIFIFVLSESVTKDQVYHRRRVNWKQNLIGRTQRIAKWLPVVTSPSLIRTQCARADCESSRLGELACLQTHLRNLIYLEPFVIVAEALTCVCV